MEKSMNNIKNKIDILFEDFMKSNLYKDYINVKNQLNKNEEIKHILDEIRRLQKIATNNCDDVIENNIKDLYEKLYSYPIYQTYIEKVESINEELVIIKENFDKYFKEILTLEK